MQQDTALSAEAQAAVDKASKLMRLAGKNPNQHEAASAMAKAMDLLAAFNLDTAAIEEHSGEKGKRSDEKLTGGLYKWQRDLWEAVAELNFCMYFHMSVFDPEKKRRAFKTRWGERQSLGVVQGGWRFQHRLVGRIVNVKQTQAMAEYLQQTVERLAREKVGSGDQFFTKWAIDYRKGIADEVIRKIYARRKQLLSEEQQRVHEAAEKAAATGQGAESTGTGITLAALTKREEDANYDFLHGEGAAAKRDVLVAKWDADWAESRKRRAEANRQAEIEYARWAEENPKEAAKEAAKERARQRRRENYVPKGRYRSSSRDSTDTGAYWAGREDGRKVSIDPQTNTAKPAGALG